MYGIQRRSKINAECNDKFVHKPKLRNKAIQQIFCTSLGAR